MRTRTQVFALTGHTTTVFDVKCQEADPQVITCSADSTIKLWDLAAGKAMSTLTHHKKGIRSLALSPNEFTFVSGAPDNIKQWKCPRGQFLQNFEGHNAVINTMSINKDNVLFSGGKTKRGKTREREGMDFSPTTNQTSVLTHSLTHLLILR